MKSLLGVFDVVPGFLWALLLAGALAWCGISRVQLSDARLATAEARVDLADYKAVASESARLAARAALAETERINSAQRNAIDEAAKETQVAVADRDDARSAAAKLRAQIARFAAAARAARESAAAVAASATGSDPIGVLADVLGRCDARAGRLAEIADRARIAGKLCERSYDALLQNSVDTPGIP